MNVATLVIDISALDRSNDPRTSPWRIVISSLPRLSTLAQALQSAGPPSIGGHKSRAFLRRRLQGGDGS